MFGCTATDTINNVKTEISGFTSIAPCAFRLLCEGDPLENDRTLADYNFGPGMVTFELLPY